MACHVRHLTWPQPLFSTSVLLEEKWGDRVNSTVLSPPVFEPNISHRVTLLFAIVARYWQTCQDQSLKPLVSLRCCMLKNWWSVHQLTPIHCICTSSGTCGPLLNHTRSSEAAFVASATWNKAVCRILVSIMPGVAMVLCPQIKPAELHCQTSKPNTMPNLYPCKLL